MKKSEPSRPQQKNRYHIPMENLVRKGNRQCKNGVCKRGTKWVALMNKKKERSRGIRVAG